MRRTRNPLLPLIATLCGLASVGFIVWALQREAPKPPLYSTTELPEETPLDETVPTSPESADATPEAPAEGAAMAESAPNASDIIPLEDTPPAPKPIPEEELTGPLPSRSPEDAASSQSASALLPAPGSITITAPPGPPSSPAALAGQPHNWPGRVVLGNPAIFPIILNGVQAGTVTAPKGSAVILKKVLPDGRVVVEWGGSVTTIAASTTDLMTRAAAVVAGRPKESAAAPASAAAGTASAAPSSSPSTPPPAALPEEAKPQLAFTVTRNRRSEGAPGGPTRQSWVFKVRVQNPTSNSFPNLNGRLFVFTKGKGEELILAANEELAADLKANAEVTLEPPPLALGPDSSYDSYAVVLRDTTGVIVGSLSFREAATKNWKKLEETKVGSPVRGQK